jgi:hypothetical protein
VVVSNMPQLIEIHHDTGLVIKELVRKCFIHARLVLENHQSALEFIQVNGVQGSKLLIH